MAERKRLFREEASARRGRAEPIDGLLRITAPHEWLFLVLLGVALLGVLAWAVLGTIERGYSADCLLVAPDEVPDVMPEDSVNGPELLALTRLGTQSAHNVKSGMRARITPVGFKGVIDAEVREVTVGDPGLRSDGVFWSPRATHSVWLDLVDDAPAMLQAGSSCAVRIVTEHRAPIRFIATVGPK